MKGKPKVVIPTASTIGTPNPFAALAETPEEVAAETVGAEAVAAVTVEDIPNDEYLPNQVFTTEATPQPTTTVIATEVGT